MLLRKLVGDGLRLARRSVGSGHGAWGGLRSTQPVSRVFGLDRGSPIDRHYIETFLARHKRDIRGRVLEIGDATYTRRFGGAAVSHSDVLHVSAGQPGATIVADLAQAHAIPDATFDCVILTQTLQFIYETRAAVAHLARIVKPGGVVLATLPGISQISRFDEERWGDYWRFTPRSAKRLFDEAFGDAAVAVTSHGNVLVATAFLQGLALEELRPDELAVSDPDYALVIAVRAQKGAPP